MIDIITHQKISKTLCGTPIALEDGFSRVELKTTDDMAADDTGLVHGGFIFGAADYAAMIAVNHPHVVLGGADVKFIKPVKAGVTIIAEAKVETVEGKKHMVAVSVKSGDTEIFKGSFACFVLDKHVLM
jgi:uncharacterized protein (TIGR00369 family)